MRIIFLGVDISKKILIKNLTLSKVSFNSKPYFDKLSKDKGSYKIYKKKRQMEKKIVSIFDTSSHEVGIFSPHLYASLMEYIVNYAIDNENIF